jgi:group I intron endonuclease
MIIKIADEIYKKWGVYKITNNITQDIYIGSTTESFKKRISGHVIDYFNWKSGMRRAMCPILYNAFQKYGIENFKVEVIYYFNRKKDSVTNKKIVTYLEEKCINKYNSSYNICRKPTLSGCPNLGRKLSKEWKEKIGEKSKLYKHSNNLKVFNNKKQQNKDLSSKYRIYKNSEEFIGSLLEIAKFLNSSTAHVGRWFRDKCKNRKGWNIEKLKSQKKKIELILENETKLFSSFGECDRFLNMWRGYTSTCIVNKKDKILNYKYKLISEDIV